jgi:EmrB/QacA subfamily drug resistance transporter
MTAEVGAARPSAVPRDQQCIPPISAKQIKVILAGAMLAMFLATLDQTIVVTAMPTIGVDLGGVEYLSWIISSYLLTATAAAPLYGKLSDIHGRRVALLVGVLTFTVGSIACALAPNMPALIVARAVQGLGGGGLIAVPQTIVGDVIPPRERGRYQGYLASTYAVSSLSGPVLGGFFADYLHWTLIFWINLPLAALSLAISMPILAQLPRHERRHRLDVLGAVLLCGATVVLLTALSSVGTRYAWSSPQIISMLAASLVLWVLFAVRTRTAAEPLIPTDILVNPVAATSTLMAFFAMGTYVGLTMATPIFFETMLQYSPSQSGLAVVPLTIGAVIGAATSGRRSSRVVHYKHIPLAGLLVAMAACLFLALFVDLPPVIVLEIVLTLLSIGIGTTMPVAMVALQNAALPHQLGTVTAVMTFSRQLGGAFLVAIFGAILFSAINRDVLDAVIAGGGTHFQPTADLTSAFRWVFIAAFIGTALAFASLMAMEEKPLRGRS